MLKCEELNKMAMNSCVLLFIFFENVLLRPAHTTLWPSPLLILKLANLHSSSPKFISLNENLLSHCGLADLELEYSLEWVDRTAWNGRLVSCELLKLGELYCSCKRVVLVPGVVSICRSERTGRGPCDDDQVLDEIEAPRLLDALQLLQPCFWVYVGLQSDAVGGVRKSVYYGQVLWRGTLRPHDALQLRTSVDQPELQT